MAQTTDPWSAIDDGPTAEAPASTRRRRRASRSSVLLITAVLIGPFTCGGLGLVVYQVDRTGSAVMASVQRDAAAQLFLEMAAWEHLEEYIRQPYDGSDRWAALEQQHPDMLRFKGFEPHHYDMRDGRHVSNNTFEFTVVHYFRSSGGHEMKKTQRLHVSRSGTDRWAVTVVESW